MAESCSPFLGCIFSLLYVLYIQATQNSIRGYLVSSFFSGPTKLGNLPGGECSPGPITFLKLFPVLIYPNNVVESNECLPFLPPCNHTRSLYIISSYDGLFFPHPRSYFTVHSTVHSVYYHPYSVH